MSTERMEREAATGVISKPEWPKPMAAEALHGPAGEFVNLIEPYTEADPAALLVQKLASFGNALGRAPHVRVSGDRHGANINIVLVGATSSGRKGTSTAGDGAVMRHADENWLRTRVVSGMSSGEGVIWAIRDAITKAEKGKKSRADPASSVIETVVVDPGVTDKRLFIMEAEFARALRVMGREGNTLSAVVRLAWDSAATLQVLTKNSPAVATNPHVSILGHITKEELLATLSETDVANGLCNRFLWCCCRRSKLLPEGADFPEREVAELGTKLRKALEHGRRLSAISRSDDFKALWKDVYPRLTADRPDLLGAMLARAAPIVLRLSLIYALLDRSDTMHVEHLRAALAVWHYAEESARFVFGDRLSDPVADALLAELRRRGGEGMTRTDIRDYFSRSQKAARVDAALTSLRESRLARCVSEPTGGKPAERWFAC